MRLDVYSVCVMLTLCLTLSGTNAQAVHHNVKCKQSIPLDLINSLDVISERRNFMGDCFTDVNSCPASSCNLRNETTRVWRWMIPFDIMCPVYGVINPIITDGSLDCGPAFGRIPMPRITSCICEDDPGLVITLTVVDSANRDTFLSGISVVVNDKELGTTYNDGKLTTTLPSTTKKVVISALDSSVNYISTVKVMDIPLGVRGPFYFSVELIKTADPVPINSSVEQQLPISKNLSDPTAGVASITIQPDSYKNQDGSPYTGTVQVSVNVIDISDPNIANAIPGKFLTRDSGITRPLISDGIFSLTFRDSSGNLLEVDSVTVDVPDGMMLWTLDADGLWERLLDTGAGRRKRGTSLNQLTVKIQNAQWVAIVKIPDAPECYFKARVFQSDGTTEIAVSTTTTFQTQVLGFITNVTPNQRLSMYTPSTRSPANTCFSVLCPAVVNNNALTGFINMTSFGTSMVDGVNVPVVQYLSPKTLVQYADFQDALSAIRYDRAPNNVDVSADFISNSTGPFYTDKSLCENSAITEPAFHFIKPPVPSYFPTPIDTDLCTARVGFYASEFYMYAQTNLSRPNVTVVSEWSDGDDKLFYTHHTVIDISTSTGNATFLSVCITYRCSKADSNNTIIHLTVNSPNITIQDYVYSEDDDYYDIEMIDVPALVCLPPWNPMKAPLAMDGSPFYNAGTSSNCTEGTSIEDFAHILMCEFYGGEDI